MDLTDLEFEGVRSLKLVEKKLFADEDTEVNCEGWEAENFLHMLQRGGEVSTSIDDITDWLDEFNLDPANEVLSEADIVTSVVAGNKRKAAMEVPKVKLSTLRSYIDALIDYSS